MTIDPSNNSPVTDVRILIPTSEANVSNNTHLKTEKAPGLSDPEPPEQRDTPDWWGVNNDEIPIPDEGTAVSVVPCDRYGVVLDVLIYFEVVHEYPGDMVIELQHNGTSVTVWDQYGGALDDDLDDDPQNDSDIWFATHHVPGFNSAELFGDWELVCTDMTSGNTGVIDGFYLQVIYGISLFIDSIIVMNEIDEDQDGCLEYFNQLVDVDTDWHEDAFLEDVYIEVSDEILGLHNTYGPFTFTGSSDDDAILLGYWEDYDYLLQDCESVIFTVEATNGYDTHSITLPYNIDSSDCVASGHSRFDPCYQQVVDEDNHCCDTEWDFTCEEAFISCSEVAPVWINILVDNITDPNFDGCAETWTVNIDVGTDDPYLTAYNTYVELYADGFGFIDIFGPFDFSGSQNGSFPIQVDMDAYPFQFESCQTVEFNTIAYNQLGEVTDHTLVGIGNHYGPPVFENVTIIQTEDENNNGCYEEWQFMIYYDCPYNLDIHDFYIDVWDDWYGYVTTVGPLTGIPGSPYNYVLVTGIDAWDYLFEECRSMDWHFHGYSGDWDIYYILDPFLVDHVDCVDSEFEFEDPCYQEVIWDDPYCCQTDWDANCQVQYMSCYLDNCVDAPFENDDPCFLTAVNNDPFCCENVWDGFCTAMYLNCAGIEESLPGIIEAHVTNTEDYNDDDCFEYWQFSINIDPVFGNLASDVYLEISDNIHGYLTTIGPGNFAGYWSGDDIVFGGWHDYQYQFDACETVVFTITAYNEMGQDTILLNVPVNGGGCNGVIGDVNQDFERNIIDVVIIVGFILNGFENATPCQLFVMDANSNGSIDIIDVVAIISYILNPEKSNLTALNTARIRYGDGEILFESDGVPAGLEIDVSGDFMLHPADLPEGWELSSSGNKILLYDLSAAGVAGDYRISYNGDLTILSALAADWHGNGIQTEIIELPQSAQLVKAYPNPFNPITHIEYELSEETGVELIIYDMLANQIETLVDGRQNSGSYVVTWNASAYSSGIYLVKLKTDHGQYHQKLLLVK